MTHRHHLGRQAVTFLVVGLGTMVLDYSTYRLLLWVGLPVAIAKASGFVVGTTAAYLINRSVTFGHAGGRDAVARFIGLYAATLLLNLVSNALTLHLLSGTSGRITLAFLVAQAVTSAANFAGLRWFVFRS